MLNGYVLLFTMGFISYCIAGGAAQDVAVNPDLDAFINNASPPNFPLPLTSTSSREEICGSQALSIYDVRNMSSRMERRTLAVMEYENAKQSCCLLEVPIWTLQSCVDGHRRDVINRYCSLELELDIVGIRAHPCCYSLSAQRYRCFERYYYDVINDEESRRMIIQTSHLHARLSSASVFPARDFFTWLRNEITRICDVTNDEQQLPITAGYNLLKLILQGTDSAAVLNRIHRRDVKKACCSTNTEDRQFCFVTRDNLLYDNYCIEDNHFCCNDYGRERYDCFLDYLSMNMNGTHDRDMNTRLIMNAENANESFDENDEINQSVQHSLNMVVQKPKINEEPSIQQIFQQELNKNSASGNVELLRQSNDLNNHSTPANRKKSSADETKPAHHKSIKFSNAVNEEENENTDEHSYETDAEVEVVGNNAQEYEVHSYRIYNSAFHEDHVTNSIRRPMPTTLTPDHTERTRPVAEATARTRSRSPSTTENSNPRTKRPTKAGVGIRCCRLGNTVATRTKKKNYCSISSLFMMMKRNKRMSSRLSLLRDRRTCVTSFRRCCLGAMQTNT